MADHFDTVYNIVFGSLLVAEAELKRKNLDERKIKEAFKELISLSRQVCGRHFSSRRRTRHLHVVGEYFPMVQRMAERWYKALTRRMSFRGGTLHPWCVIYDAKLPRELFSVVREIVKRTDYGIRVEEAKGKNVTVMAFTSAVRVQNLFCDLVGRQVDCFLLKKGKEQKKVEAIINSEKQFCITYREKQEEIAFDFFYGSWNEHGWPQHV